MRCLAFSTRVATGRSIPTFLVHMPSQLGNHSIFKAAIPQVQELRRVVCEMIRMNSFQEPPSASGLRRPDVAQCLFHCLTMILS